jgi:hypothetical protein
MKVLMPAAVLSKAGRRKVMMTTWSFGGWLGIELKDG